MTPKIVSALMAHRDKPMRCISDPSDPVLSFIETLLGNQSVTDDAEDCAVQILQEIFGNGNCGRFAVLLAMTFPGGEIVETSCGGHHAYRLGRHVYDIHGRHSDVNVDPVDAESDSALVHLIDHMDNYSFAERGLII